MSLVEPVGMILAAAAAAFFTLRRGLIYLRTLQQDEYAPGRFWGWFKARRAFDTRGSGVALAALLLCMFIGQAWLRGVVAALAAAMLIILTAHEGDPRRTGKVRLVMTPRARRIYTVALVCLGALALLTYSVFSALAPAGEWRWWWLLLALTFQAIPFGLIAAVALLAPMERCLGERYYREAAAKIAKLRPFTIGITGSYGKTSVKHMLGEVLLTCKGSTFWPGAGTNTIMGNTRAIREQLQAAHAYAVIEMAAYRRGTIAKLCELAPPQMAVITAIASMHMERFGSREEIYQAKTELARALAPGGLLICNADDDFTRRAAKEFTKAKSRLYGFAADADCRIAHRKTSAAGTEFEICLGGRSYQGFTQLLGRPALSNIAAVFLAACELGCDPELVLGALANIKPVKNRLSLEKAGKVIFLHDAYNSNPIGFTAALEVLEQMPAGRRVLMTPGMVELGPVQAEENRRLAKEAAKVCGLAIVVGEVNRVPLQEGLLDGGLSPEQIVCVPHRDQAFSELKRLGADGDVILIENDLTDWYEEQMRF